MKIGVLVPVVKNKKVSGLLIKASAPTKNKPETFFEVLSHTGRDDLRVVPGLRRSSKVIIDAEFAAVAGGTGSDHDAVECA